MLMCYTFQPHEGASIDQVVSGITPQTTLRRHFIWLMVIGQALIPAGQPHHTYDVIISPKLTASRVL